MKNEKIYNKYAIVGFPCHFYTLDACNKYNDKIEKYCNRLPEGADDLTPIQIRFMRIYCVYLDMYDGILSIKERRNR